MQLVQETVGTIQSLKFIERESQGDGQFYRYNVVGNKATLCLNFALTADGKVAGIFMGVTQILM